MWVKSLDLEDRSQFLGYSVCYFIYCIVGYYNIRWLRVKNLVVAKDKS
jgi:hypothetical protein